MPRPYAPSSLSLAHFNPLPQCNVGLLSSRIVCLLHECIVTKELKKKGHAVITEKQTLL